MLTPIHLFIILTPIGLPQDAGGNMLFQAVLGVTPECAVSKNWVCSHQQYWRWCIDPHWTTLHGWKHAIPGCVRG